MRPNIISKRRRKFACERMNQLCGLRVLNTRPADQAGLLNQAICDVGGLPISLPALCIKANKDDWLSKILPLEESNQAIFISSNAAIHCFNVLQKRNITWPTTIRVSAIGNATAATLRAYGIHVHHVPNIADSEHLVQMDAFKNIQRQTILLFKGDNGRTVIAETLLAKGANVIAVPVYRSEKPTIKLEHINSLWKDDAVDIIVFTSLQAMNNLITLFTGERLAWLCSKPCIVISERLAKEASLLGIKTVIISCYDDVVNTLIRIKKGFTHDREPGC